VILDHIQIFESFNPSNTKTYTHTKASSDVNKIKGQGPKSPSVSEEDEKSTVVEDEKTNAGITATDIPRHRCNHNILLNG
jgi:hypothetical protein